MVMPRHLLLSALILLLPFSAASALEEGEHIFIVKDYRYEGGTKPGDPDLGHSLCGTRCNSLSADYLNYTMPGAWRMIKVGSDRQLAVELDNPFTDGGCICVADEYIVKFNLDKPVNQTVLRP